MLIDITNAVARWFSSIDNGEWDCAANLMHSPFLADFASFTNEPPRKMQAAELLNAWRTLLPGFHRTHHQIGNIDVLVADNRATCHCYITASHMMLVNNRPLTWTIYGCYEIGLLRDQEFWKLESCALDFKYQDGELKLPEMARARALNLKQESTGIELAL